MARISRHLRDSQIPPPVLFCKRSRTPERSEGCSHSIHHKNRLSSFMTKPISRKMHGLLSDYPYVLVVGTAPFWLGFRDQHTPATLCFVLAGLILLTSLITRAEWGLVRVLPYKLHLALDVVIGCLPCFRRFSWASARAPCPGTRSSCSGWWEFSPGCSRSLTKCPLRWTWRRKHDLLGRCRRHFVQIPLLESENGSRRTGAAFCWA